MEFKKSYFGNSGSLRWFEEDGERWVCRSELIKLCGFRSNGVFLKCVAPENVKPINIGEYSLPYIFLNKAGVIQARDASKRTQKQRILVCNWVLREIFGEEIPDEKKSCPSFEKQPSLFAANIDEEKLVERITAKVLARLKEKLFEQEAKE